MKKIIILLTIIVIIAISTPIIGSKMMDKKITDELSLLESNGVYVEDSSKNYSYLTTKIDYKFIIKDSDKFVNYLQQFNDSKLQPYVNDIVDGIVIGIDLKYSNIPFINSDAISLDIYPLVLSKKFMDRVSKNDTNFYQFLENFLQKKALLYHIDYNIVESKFDGFIKDINEVYHTKNGKKLTFNLINSSFNGDGFPLKPRKIDSKTKEFSFYIDETDKKTKFICKNLDSSIKMDSNNLYSYTEKVESFNFKINNINNLNRSVDIKNLLVTLSSSIEQNKIQFSNKIKFDKFQIMNHNKNISLDSLNYDFMIKNIDKDSYEKLRSLLIESKYLQSKRLNHKISKTIIQIFAKGLEINLVDFSVENIDYFKNKNLNGFDFKGDLILKEDSSLANKTKYDNDLLMKNLDLKSSLNISTKLFNTLVKEFPLIMVAKIYAVESNGNFTYDVKLEDGHLNINDKLFR